MLKRFWFTSTDPIIILMMSLSQNGLNLTTSLMMRGTFRVFAVKIAVLDCTTSVIRSDMLSGKIRNNVQLTLPERWKLTWLLIKFMKCTAPFKTGIAIEVHCNFED